MENILTNDTETELRYVVMINGTPYGPKHPTPEAAAASISVLSEAQQSIAEVVPVTAEGGQLLLG